MISIKNVLLLFLLVSLSSYVSTDRTLTLVRSGEKALMNQEFDVAITMFTLAIEENPKNVSLYLMRAKAYLLSGRIMKSAEDYGKAMQIDPQYVKNKIENASYERSHKVKVVN